MLSENAPTWKILRCVCALFTVQEFFPNSTPYVAPLFYTLNNRLTYFNPALLKILRSRKQQLSISTRSPLRRDNFFNEKKKRERNDSRIYLILTSPTAVYEMKNFSQIIFAFLN